MWTRKVGYVAAIPVLWAVFGARVLASPIQYTAIDIGGLGGNESVGEGINASGQITGFANKPGGPDPFVYTPGSGILDLGISGYGYAINDRGQVTGELNVTGGYEHTFLYTPGAGVVDLGSGGFPFSGGGGINNSGVIAGSNYAPGSPGSSEAYIFTPGSGMVVLQFPFPIDGSGAGSINASGQVVGGFFRYDCQGHCVDDSTFLYTPGVGIVDLGFHAGTAINSSGQITGYSNLGADPYDAILYTPGTGVIFLPKPAGYMWSYGNALNSNGQVVGALQRSDNSESAFLYTGGVVYNLNDLVMGSLDGSLTSATGINDSGWIVANTSDRAYLLVPVPEPASGCLVALDAAALCLCWLGIWERRHRKRPPN